LPRAACWTIAIGLCLLMVSDYWPTCPMVSLLHRSCPTCGISRALRLLASGEVTSSLRLQPLALPAAAIFVATCAVELATISAGSTPWQLLGRARGRLMLISAATVCALLIALWLLRCCGYCGGLVGPRGLNTEASKRTDALRSLLLFVDH